MKNKVGSNYMILGDTIGFQSRPKSPFPFCTYPRVGIQSVRLSHDSHHNADH